MGSAAAFDLARSPAVEKVTLADQDLASLQQTVRKISLDLGEKAAGRVAVASLRLPQDPQLPLLLSSHDAVISAVPYFLNPELARAGGGSRNALLRHGREQ
jgi:saccharopine dehydrogenase-like NADP-dependent oxidoreductase